jgi:TrmH family RNA methyltransferase
MEPEPLLISSLANPRIKRAVKLRQRSHRDELGLMLIEGYRELKHAVDNGHLPVELFFCRDLFQGSNEDTLLTQCRTADALVMECTADVFSKISYRDRPDGLLALAPLIKRSLADLVLPDNPLVVIAESIEKPGNLGTILRSADAAGANAVIVCDRCTDINNPNVVRASIGTLFTQPVVEASTTETIEFLKAHHIQVVAATPHTQTLYTNMDMRGPTAIVLGTEQYGLSQAWMEQAQAQVRIPMLGKADSLNVAAAATILLFEVVRQRGIGATAPVTPEGGQTPRAH